MRVARASPRSLVRRAALLATVALVRSAPPLAPRYPPATVLARVRVALLASLAGDSLALGGHYEYDARVLAAKFNGSCTDFAAPGINHGVGWGRANYHPGKEAGELTDAGDVLLMALQHVSVLASRGARFDFDGFE